MNIDFIIFILEIGHLLLYSIYYMCKWQNFHFFLIWTIHQEKEIRYNHVHTTNTPCTNWSAFSIYMPLFFWSPWIPKILKPLVSLTWGKPQNACLLSLLHSGGVRAKFKGTKGKGKEEGEYYIGRGKKYLY